MIIEKNRNISWVGGVCRVREGVDGAKVDSLSVIALAMASRRISCNVLTVQ